MIKFNFQIDKSEHGVDGETLDAIFDKYHARIESSIQPAELASQTTKFVDKEEPIIEPGLPSILTSYEGKGQCQYISSKIPFSVENLPNPQTKTKAVKKSIRCTF